MHDTSIPPPSLIDPDDLDNNRSGNAPLRELVALRMRRRQLLRGGVGALAAASLAPLALAACGGGTGGAAAPAPAPRPAPEPGPAPGPTLGFQAVGKDLGDRITVPPGYTAAVLYATGDAIDPAIGDYRNDGSDGDFALRSGDHHDGMHCFGLSDDGRPAPDGTRRALLCINHEAISAAFLHPDGPSTIGGQRPEAEALKEVEAHGAAVLEITRSGGKYALVRNSRFNRRITPRTPMALTGPARGAAQMRTRHAPDGTHTRGMIGNCASGHTPWGTYLTCEENFAGFFRRAADDDARRSAKELTALKRVGLAQGAPGNHRWAGVAPADPASTDYARWDTSAIGGAADGSEDFRHSVNTFGWVVEIDPYDPASTPAKRTALGRFAHEGAWPSNPVPGQPLAFYMGDDSRSEYLYKFVSKARWDAADARPADRLATGAKYLDEGTLHAAKFNADGSGEWLALDLGNAAIANHAAYPFDDLADVLIHARLAADAAGATPCDRPEWTAVNPRNGEIYITMTENPDRGNVGSVSANNAPNPGLDAAFPRYWRDNKGVSTQNAKPSVSKGNVNGQVMRIRERGDDAAATAFVWDVFLFGSQARADEGLDDASYQKNVNLSGLSDANDLSKPDGCWFSRASGILWLETDDNAYTDLSNCMLLAAVPGRHGDGGVIEVVNQPEGKPGAGAAGPVTVTTHAGRRMNDTLLRRFMTAPRGAELTGLAESPDGRVLFVNIQHPGENTAAADIGDPSRYESHWPGNGAGLAAYGPGGANARPRSATVMITKDDGGVIGL